MTSRIKKIGKKFVTAQRVYILFQYKAFPHGECEHIDICDHSSTEITP